MFRNKHVIFKQAALFILLILYQVGQIISQEIMYKDSYKPGYVLMFHDEFNGPEINKSIWQPLFPWQNLKGTVYFTDWQNATIKDSTLVLTAKDEKITGEVGRWDSLGNYDPIITDFDYTSGMIFSKQAFKYGYFECRSKISIGNGLNQAFWLFGPEDMEIDIYEILGNSPHEAMMTLHWKDDDPLLGTSQWSLFHELDSGEFYSNDYYKFAVQWEPDSMLWYINDSLIEKRDPIDQIISEAVYKKYSPNLPLNIIFTNGIGGIGGEVDSSTNFPLHFWVDFIRAYSDTIDVKPVILDQKNIQITQNGSYTFNFDDFIVSPDTLKYPWGYKAFIGDGANYSVSGKKIIPAAGYNGKISVPVKIDNGRMRSDTFFLSINVGKATNSISHKKNIAFEMNYFANTKTFHLKSINAEKGKGKIDIFDSMGRKCFSTSDLKANFSISMQDFPAGFYIIYVAHNNSTFRKKILID